MYVCMSSEFFFALWSLMCFLYGSLMQFDDREEDREISAHTGQQFVECAEQWLWNLLAGNNL